MNLRPALIAAALILATAAGSASARIRNVTDADAPRSLPDQGPVSVSWEDPANFTELRYSANSWEARRGNWVEELAEYLRESVEQKLPAGERLQVDITDIRRAGSYEPWRGVQFNDTRFIRDVYPPRMTLNIRRTTADGTVIAEGERKLSDPGFLMTANPIFSSDPLRYEKAMIDRWVWRELKPES
ncbi:DUF3016 domain-containing protein [Lysobacter niastensis]|uniref:DUF3016 domain-containing protein n=1 Tax=Lysobacter niastensis TaxID=380629 RepID=A0ABS0B543_9GAMM|nr:DUF3016 domain-containing protein [Lysobacter niastensis]MBF6023893.1 DUF3016 domain-containing protein [Lysobacter niastensis]